MANRPWPTACCSMTGVVDARQMRAQYLDKMDIERERGITIKAQNVRLPWVDRRRDGEELRPAPHRHSRPRRLHLRGLPCAGSLRRCAILLVDAAQGIEAQTLANLYLALENDLTIIPGPQQDRPARLRSPTSYAAEMAQHHRLRSPGRAADQSAKTGRASVNCSTWSVRDRCLRPIGDADAPAQGDDLRLRVRRLSGRGHLRPRRTTARCPRATKIADDVHRHGSHDTLEVGVDLTGPGAARDPARRRRGRLPDPRCEERPGGQGRRHRSRPSAIRRANR